MMLYGMNENYSSAIFLIFIMKGKSKQQKPSAGDKGLNL